MTVRRSDFGLPNFISEVAFQEICQAQGISGSSQKRLREQFDELVREFRHAMSRDKQTPDRGADRDNLSKALKYTHSVKKLVDRNGPAGTNAYRRAAYKVSPMINSRWLQEKFPNDPLTPYSYDRRTPLRGFRPEQDPDDPDQRWEFVRQRPTDTIVAILDDIESALQIAMRALSLQPGAHGGRPALGYRQDLIVYLAEFWATMGRKVVGTQKSSFASFCETVFEAIGWPKDGLIRQFQMPCGVGVTYPEKMPGKATCGSHP